MTEKRPTNEEVAAALEVLGLSGLLPVGAVEALRLVQAKNKDYNSNTTRESYFPFGMASHAQMMHIKCLRIVNLVKAGEKNIQFESIRDSTKDLLNYCCFALDYLDSRL